MNRQENRFKKYLVRIMGTRWDVQSHEDKYSSGIPDLSFGAMDINGWIELKHISYWNGNKTVKPKHYTPLQVNWLNKRNKKGGHCFIMVKVDKDYFILSAGMGKLVRLGMNRNGYMDNSIWHWSNNICPEQLINILTSRSY